MWGLPLSEHLLQLLLPRICLNCGEDLPWPLEGPLCGPCLAALRRPGPVCRRCGRHWDGPQPCRSCREALSPVDLVRAAFVYGGPLSRLLHAFKYDGRAEAGRALADWTAQAFRRTPGFEDADALVPVPLHPSRERARGFDQAFLLARALSRSSGIPVRIVLARRRATRPQWRYDRRVRRRRLREAFLPMPGVDVRGRALTLVDDVCTSGGTLEACARVLRAAGARSVKAFVLARS